MNRHRSGRATGFWGFLCLISFFTVLAAKPAAEPRSVAWIPDGGELAWGWKDGWLSVSIPRLHIHGVLVVE